MRSQPLASGQVSGFLTSVAAGVTVLVLAGCAAGNATSDARDAAPTDRARPTASAPPTASAVPTKPTPAKRVYVAVGASETVGVGADDPASEAWPTVLHERFLADATLVNLGVSGSTVGQALAEQLPRALAVEPTIATVWLAVNDITHLVPVQAYEQQLQTLVHQLRRGGRTDVLVGNVPAVERLPAYRACLPGAPADAGACELPAVPPVEEVRAVVAAYNAAIERVVTAEGATLVDLSERRNLTRLTGTDGFHPSTAGHRVVAQTFARALDRLAL